MVALNLTYTYAQAQCVYTFYDGNTGHTFRIDEAWIFNHSTPHFINGIKKRVRDQTDLYRQSLVTEGKGSGHARRAHQDV